MHALMSRPVRLLAAGAALLVAASSASAQKITPMGAGDGGSPHVKAEWTVAGANVAITYGRPSLKGRPEATMMPLNKPWRTGADVASILTTDKALKFGTVTLQPGNYTLNTQPGETAWTLLLGKLSAEGQWGIPYRPELEIGKVPMTLSRNASPVEMVTFAIDPSATGGTLHVEWGTKKASVPFTVVK